MMKSFIFFMLFNKLVLVMSKCDVQNQLKEKEAPWIATLMQKEDIQCVGTLITNWHMITACTCISSMTFENHSPLDAEQYEINAGIIEYESSPWHKQSRVVSLFVPHPECLLYRGYNVTDVPAINIGIVVVKKPFDLNEYVRPIQLPPSKENAGFSEEVALLVDFYADKSGKMKPHCFQTIWATMKKQPLKLYGCPVKLFAHASCNKLIRDINSTFKLPKIDKNYLCSNRYKNACSFPKYSGTPLICSGIIVGIGTWNFTCNMKNTTLPIVYNRVDLHMDWIVEILSSGIKNSSSSVLFVCVYLLLK